MAKDVVINVKMGGTDKMLATLKDYQAGFEMIYGAVQKVGGMLDEAFTTGQKLGKMYDANTLSIEKAAAATRGYVTRLDLLKAANMSTAFGLGFTEDQFAKLSAAAVIMSQRLGTDATQAMGDLMTGLSRGSKQILDNLGIVVSAGTANEEYAKALRTTASALTDAQKAEAFKAATMREIERLTDGQTVSVKNAGDAWTVAKNKFKDYTDEVYRWTAGQNIKVLADDWEYAAEKINNAVPGWGHEAIDMITSALTGGAFSAGQFADQVERLNQELAAAPEAYKASGLMGKVGALETGAMDEGGTGLFSMNTTLGKKAKKKKTKAAKAGPEGLSTEGVQSRLKAEAMIAEMEAQIRLTDATAKYNLEAAASRDNVAKLIDSYRKKTAATSSAAEAERAETDALRKRREEQALNAQMTGMVTSTVGNLTSAIWASAEAADGSAAAFGRALVNEFRNVMKAKAIEATVLGTMAMARYALSWGTDASALTAATAYFSAAGIAGAGHAGASAISSSIGSGGGSRSSSASSDSMSSTKPSFGRATEAKKQDVYVNLYIGTPDDPGAALIGAQHVRAAIAA